MTVERKDAVFSGVPSTGGTASATKQKQDAAFQGVRSDGERQVPEESAKQ